MTTAALFVLATPVVLVAFLAVLTGLGEYRRTGEWALAVLAVPCFPLFWASWYVRDDLGSASR